MTMYQPEPNEASGVRAVASAIHEHWILFLVEGVVLVLLGGGGNHSAGHCHARLYACHRLAVSDSAAQSGSLRRSGCCNAAGVLVVSWCRL